MTRADRLLLRVFFSFVLVTAVLCASSHGAENLFLIGGGRIDFDPHSWSDSIFRSFVTRAGSGRILVLSTQTETDELPRYLTWLGAESAELVTIPRRCMADSPDMYKAISGASGLVIPDGPLWKQIVLWSGTRTESAIRDHVRAGKPLAVSGNTAQLLGGIIADRRFGVLSPEEAIRKPGSEKVTFTEDYLGTIPGVIIESHFTREGRLPPILLEMARWRNDNPGKEIVGLGIDQKTALIIDSGRYARVEGEGTVGVFRSSASTSVDLDPRTPFVMTHVAADFLTGGFVLDLSTNNFTTIPSTAFKHPTVTASSGFQACFTEGTDESDMYSGERLLVNHDRDSLALQQGLLGELPGSGNLLGCVLVTRAFEVPDYYENRVGGMLWMLFRNPGRVGYLIDRGARVEWTSAGAVLPLAVSEQPSILVFDARNVGWRDSSRRKTFPGSPGFRQSVALTGLTIHLISSRWAFLHDSGEVIVPPE